jgi:hypothetical protein
MRKLISLGTVLSLAVGGLFFADSVSARSQIAILGRAASGANETCFNEKHGPYGFVNTCTSSRYWIMPTPWDTDSSAGTKAVAVTGNADSGTTIDCYYYGYNGDGSFAGSATFPLISGTAFVAQAVFGITVSPGGFGEVYCNVAASQKARLLGLNYLVP